MTIKDCSLCGGTHYGSHECPYQCDVCKVNTDKCEKVDCPRNARYLAESTEPTGVPCLELPSFLRPQNRGAEDNRKGCAQATLCYSPTVGGISCTKCGAYAGHGEELKCTRIVSPAMQQTEGLITSLKLELRQTESQRDKAISLHEAAETALAELRGRAERVERDALEFADAVYGNWVSEDDLNDDAVYGCEHCNARFHDIADWTTVVHEPECLVNKAKRYLDAALPPPARLGDEK